MAKFSCQVGYEETVEVRPGIYEEQMIERTYKGELERNARNVEYGENINADISSSNSISIVADGYARGHFSAIRYIRWAGALWTVTEVEERRPRLIMRLGGVYNGKTAAPPEPA